MIWNAVARTHSGEALIDAVATALFEQCDGNGIRPCPALADPHWRRRAIAMLRQAHLLPRTRQLRPDLIVDGAVRKFSISHASSANEIKGQDHVA